LPWWSWPSSSASLFPSAKSSSLFCFLFHLAPSRATRHLVCEQPPFSLFFRATSPLLHLLLQPAFTSPCHSFRCLPLPCNKSLTVSSK
jgi:hypothetical protein